MRKLFNVFALLFFCNCVYSQELSQVTFSGGSNLSYFSLLTDGSVLIRISQEGQIMEWGTEEQSMRNNNYYARKLQPYPGRVEYYDDFADSASRGKVKSIGSCSFTYFGSYEESFKVGKLKTAGRNIIDYYSSFESKELKGKMKYIGSLQLAYYTSFDDDAYKGKLKSVSNTSITYYSSFDDKAIRGKLKSIGPVTYTWYTSLDISGAGGLKSGPLRQNIGGVTYIIQ
jgi:hypothetical protein